MSDRQKPAWPLVVSRQVSLQDRVDLKSRCEALALAQGLSLTTLGTSIQLERRMLFGRVEHTFSAEDDTSITLRSSFSPSLPSENLVHVASLICFALSFVFFPGFRDVVWPVRLSPLIAGSVFFYVVNLMRASQFRKEATLLVDALEAKSPNDPYRVATDVRVEVEASETEEGVDEEAESPRALRREQ